MSAALAFSCPHCQHPYVDELELLSCDELHAFRCENCAQHFMMQIEECTNCSSQTTFVWSTAPTGDVISELVCGTCGMHCRQSQDLEDADHVGEYI